MITNSKPRVQRKGSGRTKGSVSFCAIKMRDFINIFGNVPDNGTVIVSRKWVQMMNGVGYDTRPAKPIFKNSLTQAQ